MKSSKEPPFRQAKIRHDVDWFNAMEGSAGPVSDPINYNPTTSNELPEFGTEDAPHYPSDRGMLARVLGANHLNPGKAMPMEDLGKKEDAGIHSWVDTL